MMLRLEGGLLFLQYGGSKTVHNRFGQPSGHGTVLDRPKLSVTSYYIEHSMASEMVEWERDFPVPIHQFNDYFHFQAITLAHMALTCILRYSSEASAADGRASATRRAVLRTTPAP